MKKIFCVMVAVVLCFGAVLVSASAETPMYNYNGVSMPYPPVELADTEYQYFTIFKENDGDFTLCASVVMPKVSADKIDVFFAQGSKYSLYTLNDGVWVKFGDYNITNQYGQNVAKFASLLWSSNSILNSSGTGSAFAGDANFVFPPPLPAPPLHEEINLVTGEAVNGLANDTFDTLGVLVPIGIGFMAIFLGVALIPRVIYKFL